MNNIDGNILYYDILVVGAGVCGMFFATKLANSDKNVVIIENASSVGGQLNLYKEKHIYNIPLISEIKSCEVIDKLNNDILKQTNCDILFNTKILSIQQFKEEQQDIFLITLFNRIKQSNIMIKCKYLVIATGKGEEIPKKLQVINADKYEGKNIFYSVDDEKKFIDKDIVIAGGGDSVIDWSVELVDIVKSITIIHRRNINKIDNSNFLKFQSLCNNGKIKLKYPFEIANIIGNNGCDIDYIEVKNIENQQIENIKCDNLLVFYGLQTIQSGNDILNNLNIEYGINGIKVDYRTNCVIDKSGKFIDNIFAIGDCCDFDGKVKNIVSSFIDGIRCYYKICKDGKVRKYEHQ